MAIRIQNALSAYVYLITWFLSGYCKLNENKEANLSKGRRRVAKKDRTDEQNKRDQLMASIANGSQNVLQLLYEKVLERDIHLLWSEQKIDAGFV